MVSSTSSIMAAVNSTMITDHRYYPLEVGIASYLVNDLSVATLLSTFFGGMALFVLGTRFVVDKIHPNLPLSEKAAIWWFVLSKCTPFDSIVLPDVHGIEQMLIGFDEQLARSICFSKVVLPQNGNTRAHRV